MWLYIRNEAAATPAGASEIAITWHQANRWFGVVWDRTTPLNAAGVIDIGDANDSIFMATPLSIQKTRAVEQYLGMANNTLQGANPCEVLFALRQSGVALGLFDADETRHFHVANPDVMGLPLAVWRGLI